MNRQYWVYYPQMRVFFVPRIPLIHWFVQKTWFYYYYSGSSVNRSNLSSLIFELVSYSQIPLKRSFLSLHARFSFYFHYFVHQYLLESSFDYIIFVISEFYCFSSIFFQWRSVLRIILHLLPVKLTVLHLFIEH